MAYRKSTKSTYKTLLNGCFPSKSKRNIYKWLMVSIFVSGSVHAVEGITPMQPGLTTGNPAGMLPPPGVYLSTDVTYEEGKVKNGEGNTATLPTGQQIKAENVSAVAVITWVPGWKVFGADYAMAFAQPYKWAETQFNGAGNSQTVKSDGAVNTAIVPAILSWDLGKGFHLGTGVAVRLKNGKFRSSYNEMEERNVKTASNIANRYWTIEPNLALTYVKDDWSFTANNVFDFNTKNKDTQYRSGNVYYLDLTATKRINNFTLGLLGSYTRQISDDKVKGKRITGIDGFSSDGNRMEQIKAGPLLSYDFGKFSVVGRILFHLKAKNDGGMTFYHIGVNIPFPSKK